MDDLDKYISRIVNKKIHVPKHYEETIKEALFKEKNINRFNIVFKCVASIITCVLTIGGLVFAMQISRVFNKNIRENYIDVSEYVQNLDIEYQTEDNLSIKVDSLLLDDRKMELIIDYLYTEPITSAESKILIKDEENNILYENNLVVDYELKKFDRYNFIKNRNINESIIINPGEISEENEINTYLEKYNSCYKNKTSNNIKRTISLYSNFNKQKFPNSKKIYIELKDIVLRNDKNKVKEIKGKWNFEININERFRNRNTWKYKEIKKEIYKDNFDISDAELSNVQLLLRIKNKGKVDLSNLKLESIQIWDELNKKFIIPEEIKITENNIIDVNYNIDSKMFSNIIKGKIEGYQNFYIEKIK